MLYLLNSEAVPESNSTLANLGGIVLLVITSVLAANFVRSQALGSLGDPLPTFVVVFAVVLGILTLVLVGKYAREAPGDTATR